MKIYFNANNKATLDALEKCGVKNVLLSHKYSHTNIEEIKQRFSSIFVVSGTNDDEDKYHEFIKKEEKNFDFAAQFSIPNNMNRTCEIWKKEKDMGLNTLPVLQEDYIKHLSQLNLKPNSHICVGQMKGRFDTEDSIKKLPTNNKYHGIGKGKYLLRGGFDSIDTSIWISAAMSKKCDIWSDGTIIKMKFGENNVSEPILTHHCEKYKDNLEKIGVKMHEITERHYYSMLKLPIALYYMPICKHLKCYTDNFIK